MPPEKVGDYLRDFRDLLEEFDYHAALYGHFGQGCIHCRIDFRLSTAHGVRQWRQFLTRAAELVASYGGSLSGEHGDGQARGALLTTMYGEELVAAFGEFKAVWDPDGMMNPGKVVHPHDPTDDLREGPQVRLTPVRTHFAFPDDDHDFGKATARCVGVGQCRNVDTGGMCPSYMATREEEDSTRGRARMLFEMLRGDEPRGGWRDVARRRRPRALPGLQGVQARVPGQRRHGDVQGRVPLALLQGPAPPAQRLRHHPHLLVGPPRQPDAAARQRRDAERGAGAGAQEGRWGGAGPGHPQVPGASPSPGASGSGAGSRRRAAGARADGPPLRHRDSARFRR